MATYIVTLPSGEDLNARNAPDPDVILRAVAQAVYGEDVSGHARYFDRDDHTGDEVTHHHRLGLTVRRIL